MAVGKNYSEHAKEFNASGYDASDKNDMPSHPVIFTKRATSIIANEQDILLHQDFTETLDYEGEIGVIIGKGGFQISEADAERHVWGYTIINDVTAREKQRDHKQFFIGTYILQRPHLCIVILLMIVTGKSADTFCPMGPIAVPVSALPKVLKVTTLINGEKRQEGTTEDLIFSVPNLIHTLSASQTLRPGDVIATGTPAGVGFGLKPPVFLKPGDLVEISVSGLGTLRNRIAKAEAPNYVSQSVAQESVLPPNNLSITMGGIGLTTLSSGKRLNTKKTGNGPRTIVFVHGLGGNMSSYTSLINNLELGAQDHNKYTCLLHDLEGQGLSPTTAASIVSIESFANDLHELIQFSGVPTNNGVTIIAHSMGCLVAELYASQHPELVQKIILLGPPPCPLPEAGAQGSIQRAATVRKEGMRNVAVAVSEAGTSAKTKSSLPLALAAVQMSLLSQDPEGYAKGCTALAGAKDLHIDLGALKAQTLIVAGDQDKVSTPAYAEKLAGTIKGARIEWLKDVGHWHGFEDVEGLSRAVKGFL